MERDFPRPIILICLVVKSRSLVVSGLQLGDMEAQYMQAEYCQAGSVLKVSETISAIANLHCMTVGDQLDGNSLSL